MRVRLLGAAFAASVLVWGIAQANESATEIEIGPGPAVISPEEAAIVADPKAGIQHGVVLVQEIERNEDHETNYEYTFHMRAKILSPEARSLGDIVIGDLRSRHDLKRFWARTILPNGKVLGLIKSQLEERTTVSVKGVGKIEELRGALPGIVPGCVIDYGYVVRGEGFYRMYRVALQGNWPVRYFRYRWVPSRYFGSAHATTNVEGKDVKVTTDRRSTLVVGRNLDPVPDEPYTLPHNVVRATVIFYYTSSKDDPKVFWNETAKVWDDSVASFAGKGEGVRDAIARIGAPADAPLPDRLHAAYAWVQAHVANTDLESSEQAERTEEKPKAERKPASDPAAAVIAAKRGNSFQIDYLFAAIARVMGADADMLYAVDRTRNSWIRPLKVRDQFEYAFAAVRDPASSGPYTVLAPGSGLPYGQLPWRATGTTGMLATSHGAVDVPIHPAPPDVNSSSTRASISFADAGETIEAKWSRSSAGAGGQDGRRTLRAMNPDERKKAIDAMCRGDATGAEVAKSEAPSLDDLDGAFRLSCDLDLGESNVKEDLDRFTITFEGPWWPDTPYLSSPTRVQPVVFAYPFHDDVSVDVAAPPGFRPVASVPAPIDRESGSGRYRLSITVRGDGYHVERELTILRMTVAVPEYPELRTFLQAVADGDRTPLIFRRAPETP